MRRVRLLAILSLLLALCMVPGALGAEATARELFGSRLIDGEEQLRSVAVLDGAAYLLTTRAYYRYTQGDKEARRIADAPQTAGYQTEPAVSSLFAHAGQLKGFNNQTGQVFEVAFEDAAVRLTPSIKVDLSEFESDGGGGRRWVEEFQRLVVAGDLLFAKAMNWGNERDKDLYSYDLKSGEEKVYTPKHLQGLVPYKEGKLIGIYFDQNVSDPKTYQQMDGELTVFDPAADKTEKLSWPLPEDRQGKNRDLKLYYDADSDSLYAATASGIVRLSPDKAPEQVARLPMAGSWSGFESGPTLLPWGGEQLLVGFGMNVFLRGRDPAQMKPVTTLRANSSFFGSNALSKTLMQLEDIDLQFYQGDYLDAQAIQTQFLTGEMTFDLLMLHSTEHDIQKLIQKGYLADLSDSAELVKLSDDMLPALQPLIHLDGKLYAVPLNLQTYYLTGNVQFFKDIGQEMPKSVPELIALTRWWAEEGHAEHEGYVLFEQADAKRQIKDLIHTVYVDALLGARQPLQFDMERYGRLMQEVDGIDFSTFDLKPSELPEDNYGMMEGKALMMAYLGYDAGYPRVDEKYEIMLELSLDGQTPAWREGTASFAAIPSTSRNAAAARRFLEAYMNNLEPIVKAGMSRSWDEDIENPNWEWGYQEQQRYLAQYEKLYEEAEEGPQKRQYAQDVENMKKSVENYEADNRYRLTRETIRKHRALMEKVYLPDSLGQTQRQALVKDEYLLGMYLEGALTLEQFIQQANDKIRLMTLEAE